MDKIFGMMTNNIKKNISKSEGGVKYSCNFSNKDFTTEQFKNEVTNHFSEISHAVLLDCSYNNIDILVLKNHKGIETVKASNNILYKVDLLLVRLKSLDLSYNKLKDIPNLSSLKQLQILLLNDNLIRKISFKSLEDINNLICLDLSRNKIRFESVEDFRLLGGTILQNFDQLDSLSFLENPFTFEIIYKDRYFDYYVNLLPSLTKMNHKIVTKIERNKDMPKSLIAGMLEKESSTKNPSATLERIVNHFEKVQLDDSEFILRFPKIEKRLVEYTKEILNEELDQGEEYITDDKDSYTFEKLINLSKLAIENFQNFDHHVVNIFIHFSSIRKGKWAKQCFSFLRHISNSDDSLQTRLENEIYNKYYPFYSLLKFIKPDSKISHNKDKKTTSKKEIDELLDDMPLVLRGVKHFINSKFPKVVEMFYQNIMFFFENEYFNINKLKILLDHINNQLSNIDITSSIENKKINKRKDNYESIVKYNLFKYTVNILCLSFKMSCISIIIPYIKSSHIEKLFQTTLWLFDFYNSTLFGEENKNVLDTCYKLLNKLLFICVKLLSHLNKPNLSISIEKKIIIEAFNKLNKKSGIIDSLKEYVNKIYMNGSYRLYNVQKYLLNKNDLNKRILGNKILRLVFKLFFLLTSLYQEEITKNLNNIIGLIMNNYSFSDQSVNDGKIRMECDPFMLESSNYILLYILKNYKIFYKNDMTSYKLFFNNLKQKFKILLEFINENSDFYKNACRIGYIYTYREMGSDSSSITCISSNGNFYVCKMINSIINFLVYFGSQGKYEENLEIRNQFIKYNAELNKYNRDNYLIKCLTIPEDKIKSKAMSCFLTVRYDEISTTELGGLLNTISNANWLEGKMEKIIADTFFFVMQLFHQNFKDGDPLPFKNSNVIEIALKIIEKNTERTSFKKEDVSSIRLLNLSVVTLLINLSGYQNFCNVFDRSIYVDFIKNTLLNEYQSGISNKKIDQFYLWQIFFPLELEKCFTMWKVENIKTLFSGQIALNPYNYISLRIFNHLANVLMNIPYITFDISENKKFQSEEILKSIYTCESSRINLEKLGWKNFKIEIKKKFSEVYFSQESILSRLNGIIKLNASSFLEQHYKFVEHFRFFLEWLTGEANTANGVSELTENLYKNKYDPQMVQLDKVTFFKKDTNPLQEVIKNFNLQYYSGNRKNSVETKPDNNKEKKLLIQERDIKEYSKFFLRAYNQSNFNSESITNKISLYSYVKDDIGFYDNYAESEDKIIRDNKLECVDNINLRSLFVSIFLRCIYAILKVKPILGIQEHDKRIFQRNNVKNDPKVKLIANLRSIENFHKLVTLVDSTRIFSCNISSKFLTILNFIFKNLSSELDCEKNSDSIEKLVMLSSMMISKIIFNLKYTHIEQDEKSALIDELVKACLTIIRELNFISGLSQKTKHDLIYKIISNPLVEILIQNIIHIMESQDKLLVDTKYLKKVNFSESTERILRLLAEYMALTEDNAYYITEIFHKNMITNKKLIRKSFLCELAEYHKCVKMKMYVKENPGQLDENLDEKDYKFNKSVFSSDCLYFDHDSLKKEKKFFFLTHHFIYFQKYFENFLHKSFDYTKIYLSKVEKEFKFDIKDLKKVYFSNFPNRVFFSFKDRNISLLFKNSGRVKLLFDCLINNEFNLKIDLACKLFCSLGENFENLKNKLSNSEDKQIQNGNFNSRLQMDKNKEVKFTPELEKLLSFNRNLYNSVNLNETKNLNTTIIGEGKNNDSIEKKLIYLDKNLLSYSEFKKKVLEERSRSANNLNVSKSMNESIILDKSLNQSNLNVTRVNINDKSTVKNKKDAFNNQIQTISSNLDFKNQNYSISEIRKHVNKQNVFLVSIDSKKLCDLFSADNKYISCPKIISFEILELDKIQEISELENKNTIPEKDIEMPQNFPATMKVYVENYDYLIKLPINDEYLKGELSSWFRYAYSLTNEYDLNDLYDITFQSYNIINLNFNWTSVKIIFHDDYSYFNTRSILLTFVKSKNFEKINLTYV